MTSSLIDLSRRGLILGAGASVAACVAQGEAPPRTLTAAVTGSWRILPERARDGARHPLQSLTFWGLKPGASVVEFWPGAGWYSNIIAPFLAGTGGTFYAAQLQPTEPAARAAIDAYTKKLAAKPRLYGKPHITAFGPTSGPVAPAGTADLALFLRNLHNWMAAGIAEKAFRDAFAALKPGGSLGIEEHRAAPGGVQDPLAANGYVQEAYAIRLATEAGFKLAARSEINANPKDTRDHPFGVWTLPPTRLTAPRGQPINTAFDGRKYDAIGESDRMTLRFVKPS